MRRFWALLSVVLTVSFFMTGCDVKTARDRVIFSPITVFPGVSFDAPKRSFLLRVKMEADNYIENEIKYMDTKGRVYHSASKEGVVLTHIKSPKVMIFPIYENRYGNYLMPGFYYWDMLIFNIKPKTILVSRAHPANYMCPYTVRQIKVHRRMRRIGFLLAPASKEIGNWKCFWPSEIHPIQDLIDSPDRDKSVTVFIPCYSSLPDAPSDILDQLVYKEK